MADEHEHTEELDALCRECGHAFKTYMDRIIPAEKKSTENKTIACPVCGCGECSIGK